MSQMYKIDPATVADNRAAIERTGACSVISENQTTGKNYRTVPTTLTEGATASASRDNRTAIPVSCALHRGPRGFANLVVERKRDGEIVLDPHVTGACVIILDEDATTALFDILGTWLR